MFILCPFVVDEFIITNLELNCSLLAAAAKAALTALVRALRALLVGDDAGSDVRGSTSGPGLFDSADCTLALHVSSIRRVDGRPRGT